MSERSRIRYRGMLFVGCKNGFSDTCVVEARGRVELLHNVNKAWMTWTSFIRSRFGCDALYRMGYVGSKRELVSMFVRCRMVGKGVCESCIEAGVGCSDPHEVES